MGAQSNILSRYWSRYGGWNSLCRSIFFRMSVLTWFLLTPLWWQGGVSSIALSVLPSLLGFSIASFTMLLAIGDEEFRRYLSVKENKGGVSRLLVPATSFFHFVIFQVIAITLALLASAHIGEFLFAAFQVSPGAKGFFNSTLFVLSKCLRGLASLVFVYAVISGIAAMMNVYRLTEIYVTYSKVRARYQKKSCEKCSQGGKGD